MNKSQEQLSALEIDVATWRRDIQTFVDMTVDELNSINGELATGFSGTSTRPRRRPSVVEENRSTETEESNLRHNARNRQSPHQSRTDERLNQLKRKLELKLSAGGGAK